MSHQHLNSLCCIGVVVIGRNEGTRLLECLKSVSWSRRVVYADSDSSDGSTELAANEGALVVRLTAEIKMTAARGRAEGLKSLLLHWPNTKYVFFVDGDSVVETAWLTPALRELEREQSLAVICGLRREAYPENSVYNRIMNMEWAAGSGDIDACGGDALMKVDLIQEAGGFDPSVTAGEEPELCFRIRGLGYHIRRIPEPMTIHDARMVSLSQWLRRERRSGLGAYEVWRRCGQNSAAPFAAMVRSALIWGGLIPIVAVLVTVTLLLFSMRTGIAAAAMFSSLYVLQGIRISRMGMRRGLNVRDSFVFGFVTIAGKFSQVLGLLGAARTSFLPQHLRVAQSPVNSAISLEQPS